VRSSCPPRPLGEEELSLVALIEAYFDVIRDGGIDRLAGIVTDDYDDHNPVRGQLVGRYGIMQKTLLFRAEHPGARMVIEAIEITPQGATAAAGGPQVPTLRATAAAGGPQAPTLRATWTTTAPNLDGTPAVTTWRYVGDFTFAGGKIRSSKVERIGQVE